MVTVLKYRRFLLNEKNTEEGKKKKRLAFQGKTYCKDRWRNEKKRGGRRDGFTETDRKSERSQEEDGG